MLSLVQYGNMHIAIHIRQDTYRHIVATHFLLTYVCRTMFLYVTYLIVTMSEEEEEEEEEKEEEEEEETPKRRGGVHEKNRTLMEPHMLAHPPNATALVVGVPTCAAHLVSPSRCNRQK